jgi:hypothetical protein
VVAAVHDKFHTGGNGAKLADGECITDKIEVVAHVFFKIVHIFKIIVVGKIADADVWAGDDVF